MAGPVHVHGGTGELIKSPAGIVFANGGTLPTGPGYPAGSLFVKTGSSAGFYVNQGDSDGANFSQQEADSLFDSSYTIGRTAADPPELTQRTLTSSNPARRAFRGISPFESKVTIDSSVAGSVGSPTAFIVNDSSTQHMEVANVRIDGGASVGSFTALNPVDHVTNGVNLAGLYCRVDRCIFENIAGSAIRLQNGQSALDNNIDGVINGIEVVSSDSSVSHNKRVESYQNAGVLISSGVGHTSVEENHFFDGKYAIHDSGGGTKSHGNMYADSYFGTYYHALADNGTFTGDRWQHNRTRGMYVAGTNMSCLNCLVDCQMQVDESDVDTFTGCMGIEIASTGDRFSFIGGKVELTNYYHEGVENNPVVANCAIKVAGDNCIFDTRLIDFDQTSASIGVRISGAIKGGYFRFRTFGFTHASDRLLIIDNVGLLGCTFIFEGPGLDTDNPGNLVDVGADWMTAGSGNSITITNTTTGTTIELTNQAY